MKPWLRVSIVLCLTLPGALSAEEVLLDVLGWDWDRISALREKAVI